MKRSVLFLVGTIFLLGLASMAQAFTMTLSSGGQTVVVNDNGLVTSGNIRPDLDPTSSSIIYSGVLNGISVSAIGTSVFDPKNGSFDLSSFVFRGTGTITIKLTDSGLALNTYAISPNISIVQYLSNTTSSNVQLTSDVLVNGSSVPGVATSVTGMGNSTASGLATVGNTFSLEEIITATLTGNSSVSIDGLVNVAPVPEPGTMLLLGIGLLSIAIASKRRMNKRS